MTPCKQRILTFDPALSESGYAVMDVTMEESKMDINIHHFGSFFTSKITGRKAYDDLTKKFGQRVITLVMLRDQIMEIFNHYKPDHVVCEDIFFNPGRPTAYLALAQWIITLEMLMYEQGLPVYKIPTKSAKACVAGHGGSGKANVQEAIMNLKNLTWRKKLCLDELTEHPADAIAVGYTFIVNGTLDFLNQQSAVVAEPTA